MYKLLLLLTLYVANIHSESCTTPNGEQAQCISLYDCKIILHAVDNNVGTSAEFARASSCGCNCKENLVCCGTSADYKTPPVTTPKPKESLLPPIKFCGLQHSDDFPHDTEGITLTEFPWLARITHGNAVCSGTLISNRYVITSVPCANHTSGIKVELGEYYRNTTVDCTQDGPHYECSDPTLTIDVEKSIIHPKYNDRYFHNDIALLRLKKKIQYSDFIRPICLPWVEKKFAAPGDVLLTTGWGMKAMTHPHVADLKKKGHYVMVSNEECNRNLSGGKQEVVSKEQFCTLAHNDTEFQCAGDAGGPVMFAPNFQWFLEGIISVTFEGCDPTLPAIQTRVSSFMQWILDSIEP